MWPKYHKRLKWDESYLKYIILYIFSLILVVFAITQLFVSNGVSYDIHNWIDELSHKSAIKVSVALSLLSFVIILIAFIGCCATYTKSKLILVLFCLLLVFLVTIEIFSTYNSFYYNSKIKDETINERFKDLTEHYNWYNQSDPGNRIVDSIQCLYNCCGTYSYRSWDDMRPDIDWYPMSCCCHIKSTIDPINCTQENVNKDNSCFSALNHKLEDIRYSVSLMAAIAIANSLIKLIGIPLVWYYGRQLQDNYIV